MDKIDMTFLRTVLAKIEDCSSPLHLRKVLEQFKPYLYNGQIYRAFKLRCEALREINGDAFSQEKCDELEEELEVESQIASVCKISAVVPPPTPRNKRGRKKDLPLEASNVLHIELKLSSFEGRVLDDTIIEVLKVIIEKALGKKKETARILGISEADLAERMRNSPELRKFAKHVRKEVRLSDIPKRF